jgi:integrase
MEANDRATRHQALRQFFLHLVDEGELTDSPMARMKPPSIPDVPVPIVTDNDLRKLLKVCEGTDPTSAAQLLDRDPAPL